MNAIVLLVSLLGYIALGAGSAAAQAPDYPNRPIRMVVGFPPGGGADTVARIISARLAELLGQPVVVENKPGAAGTIAAASVAKSPADGYVLMMGAVSVNAMAPALFLNLGYDTAKDFAPIAIVAAVPQFVVVHPSVPANTLNEMIVYLKARPATVSYPSAGNGSMPHLAGEIFKSLAGVDILHVPYKGTGQSMQDLLAGTHAVAFDTVAASAPQVRAGKLRALAVSSAQRLPTFPDVPTAREAGLPGFELSTWYGVFAPAGTPTPILNQLNQSIAKALQTPDIRSRLEAMGSDGAVSKSPEDFAEFVRVDTARYAKIIKDTGLRVE